MSKSKVYRKYHLFDSPGDKIIVTNALENYRSHLLNSNKLNQMTYLANVLPYLNTNTSKQVEYTKAFELTIIKELGKLTRVTSGEGGPSLLINIRYGIGGTEWCCTTV